MDIETRLRMHFTGARFRSAPDWEDRVLANAEIASPSRSAGWAWPIAGVRRRVLFGGGLALIALSLAITGLSVAAGQDTPAWVAGIRTAVHIDSAGQGRATSWGTTVEVIGAYLDDQRVIVVVGTNDRQLQITNFYLVQNGKRYNGIQTVSSGDGYVAIKFEPVPEALSSQVPVTLHLGAMPARIWKMNFTIGPRAAGSLGVPPPGRAGNMTITFTSVTAVPGAFAIRFTETGFTYDEILGPVHVSNSGGIQMTGRGPLTVRAQVFDVSGKYLRWLDLQLSPAVDGSASVTFSEVFLRSGPGPYRIVITGPDGTSLERSVEA